jgi:hypothetical protein
VRQSRGGVSPFVPESADDIRKKLAEKKAALNPPRHGDSRQEVLTAAQKGVLREEIEELKLDLSMFTILKQEDDALKAAGPHAQRAAAFLR